MEAKNFTAEKIVQLCNGKQITGDPFIPIKTFSKDTRELQQGDCYIGIKGANFNGSLFWKEAFEAGAGSCIIEEVEINQQEKEKYQDKVIIQVKNTLEALKQLAIYKREQYDIPVIAITGSVGKTSTKDIIASVLSQQFSVLKTEGSYNNDIGLPLTILRLQQEECMVLEMGMNHLGEIRYLTQIARPNMAIITNVGTPHIGLLGSIENILKAKLEILEGLKPGGIFLFNQDNPYLSKWYQEQKEQLQQYQAITYGKENKSDYFAYNITCDEKQSQFCVRIENEEKRISVPVSGEHFVYNSLCALAVGRQFGLSIDQIQAGISQVQLSKKRMDIHKIKENITIINDSYNASYDAMIYSLKYLQIVKAKRKIAVIGNMLELGDYTKELHEKTGEEVVKDNIDCLVTVGEFAKYVATRALELGMNKDQVFICKDIKTAIEVLNVMLQPEDAVLLKASKNMNFYKIEEGIQ